MLYAGKYGIKENTLEYVWVLWTSVRLKHVLRCPSYAGILFWTGVNGWKSLLLILGDTFMQTCRPCLLGTRLHSRLSCHSSCCTIACICVFSKPELRRKCSHCDYSGSHWYISDNKNLSFSHAFNVGRKLLHFRNKHKLFWFVHFWVDDLSICCLFFPKLSSPCLLILSRNVEFLFKIYLLDYLIRNSGQRVGVSYMKGRILFHVVDNQHIACEKLDTSTQHTFLCNRLIYSSVK